MKYLQKSTFIMSLIAVLMLLVALSTATYAWFSSDNIVNLSTISFTAETSSSKEGELTISWDKNKMAHDTIRFKNNTPNIDPMIPSIKPYLDMSYEEFLDNFNAGIEVDSKNGLIYNYDGIKTTPYTCERPEVDDTPEELKGVNHFYVHNGNQNGVAMNITIEYAFRNDDKKVTSLDGKDPVYLLKDFLRIAVFVNGKLKGIMATTPVNYGAITKGQPVSSTPSTTELTLEQNEFAFKLEADEYAEVTFVTWLDGVGIKSSVEDHSITSGYLSHELKKAELQYVKFLGTYTAD